MQKSLKFLKGLAVVSCVGMVFFSLGCFDDPVSDEDSVVIQITSFATMTPGATKQIQGTIEASPAIDEAAITIALTKDGADASTHFETPTLNDIEAAEDIDLETDLGLKITPKTTIPSGTYVLSISATAGTANSSDNVTFTVTNTGTPVTIANVIAGANQNATYGSSIDLDEPKVMLKAEADANVSKIDVCYAFSGTDNVEKLFSPHHAKASGYTFAADWATPNQTKFYKTTLTPAQYDAITTKEELALQWTEPGSPATSITCALNDVFIAKTEQNALVLLLITAQTAGATGTIDIKIAK